MPHVSAFPGISISADSQCRACVVADRIGHHDFSSTNVEYEAGGALQEYYGTEVELKEPELLVRVDVVGPGRCATT